MWLVPVLIVLTGFALRARVPRLGNLGFDGGLGVALASSPVAELLALSARDVHPPLYYLALAAWCRLAGPGVYVALWPSLALGALAVAAIWRLARPVGRGTAVAAATLLALSPLHVQDGMAARDVAALVPLTLLSTALLLDPRGAEPPGQGARASSRLGVARAIVYGAGLLSSYYFVLTVLAHAALVLWRGRRDWRPWAVTVAPGAIGLAGWLALSAQQIGPAIVAGARPTSGDPPRLADLVSSLIQTTVGGPAIPTATAAAGSWAMLAAWGAILSLAPPLRRAAGLGPPPATLVDRWLVGLIGFEVALVGIAATVSFWLREAPPGRYALGLLPWVALLVGLGLGAVVRVPDRPVPATGPRRPDRPRPGEAASQRSGATARARAIGLLLAGSLTVFALAPPLVGLWSGWRPTELPRAFFDPGGLATTLDEVTRPGDAVTFISLEQAGYYATLARQPRPAAIVPVGPRYLEGDLAAEVERKLAPLLAAHDRVHLVLYQGGIAPRHRIVRDWLGSNGFLAGEHGLADSRLLTYLLPRGPVRELLTAPVAFPGAQFASARAFGVARPGEQLGLELTWRADRALERSYSVFVHLLDSSGEKVAQHDAGPADGARPTDRWQPGETIADRHGLELPSNARPPFELLVGLYDATGARFRTESGQDAVRIPIGV